jgi:hypothetical protein
MSSFFTITIVSPAIPRFFWAPAKIRSKSLILIGLVHKVDDISHIIGPLMSGVSCISNPCTVSLAQ